VQLLALSRRAQRSSASNARRPARDAKNERHLSAMGLTKPTLDGHRPSEATTHHQLGVARVRRQIAERRSGCPRHTPCVAISSVAASGTCGEVARSSRPTRSGGAVQEPTTATAGPCQAESANNLHQKIINFSACILLGSYRLVGLRWYSHTQKIYLVKLKDLPNLPVHTLSQLKSKSLCYLSSTRLFSLL